jgi:hypothetical protein
MFQLAGFATCGLLLGLRDRSALLASENRSIGRLAVGALVAIPFIVTDFRVLAPDFPVRLGALRALLVVTAVLIAGGAAETRRQARHYGFAARHCSVPLPRACRGMSI